MKTDPFRLDGRTALVTGGGSGIGFGIARAMADAGASVIIVGRRERVLVEACEKLGSSSDWIQHDINETQAAGELVREVDRRFGRLDILVNNAGTNLKMRALDTPDEGVLSLMQTHVFGSFALSREFGRTMVERGTGSILMIASMTSLFGIPYVSAYSAAKSALLGLTRTLAVEFGESAVRVNAIAPGWIVSEMSSRALDNDPERKSRILGRTPMKRLGDPIEIGYAAVYLSSAAASFVTGVVLPVDGGASIGF